VIVRVRLAAALAEHAEGQREVEVEVADGATLGEALEILAGRYPLVGRRVVDETGALRRYVNVYVGDEECRRLDGLTTVLPPGAQVSIIGSIAGG